MKENMSLFDLAQIFDVLDDIGNELEQLTERLSAVFIDNKADLLKYLNKIAALVDHELNPINEESD